MDNQKKPEMPADDSWFDELLAHPQVGKELGADEHAVNAAGLTDPADLELEQIILHTVVVEESALDHSAIHLGSTVVLRDAATGKEKKYAIVGSNEANPMEGRISDRSPIGSAIPVFTKELDGDVGLSSAINSVSIIISIVIIVTLLTVML